jgi:very-short-patch-repair endonuclease
MHYGAPQGIKTRAKALRQPQTPAECRFWQYVRNRRMCGYKFRRQHPVGNFIVDFYCHRLRLIVEIDGNIHSVSSVQNHDPERENKLKEMGLSILRFSNQDVFHNPVFIELTIIEFIETRKSMI